MSDPRPLPDDNRRHGVAERGRLTREAGLLLATVAAECLYECLTLAGIVLSGPVE